MPTQREKSNLIDKFNEAFLEEGNKQIENDFERYLKRVIIESTKEGKTNKQIKRIILDTPISDKAYIRQVYNSLILSGITNQIEDQKQSKEDKELFAPIAIILGLYGRNTDRVAGKTNLLVNRFLRNNATGLNKTDKVALKSFKTYFGKNAKTVKKLLKRSKKQIARIHRLIKRNASKDISKALQSEKKERVIEKITRKGVTTEVSRPKSKLEIRRDLRSKFNKQLDYRVRRIVDTELKELHEQAKIIQHLGMGFTHKKWNTQLDKDVRPTHKKLQGKTIAIDKKFRVGGAWGLYPGDPDLPPKERINERCYLTYIKR